MNVSNAIFCKVIVVLLCQADTVLHIIVMEKQRNMIKCGEVFNVEQKTSSDWRPFEADYSLNSRQMPKTNLNLLLHAFIPARVPDRHQHAGADSLGKKRKNM